MFDYYRFRFKDLLPRRRPISDVRAAGPAPVVIPRNLGRLCWLSWISSGIAVAIAIRINSPPTGFLSALVSAQLLLVPVSFALGAGFSERQTWTRPLLVAHLAFCSAILFVNGARGLAAVCTFAAAGMGLYLYRAPQARSYYAHLREEAIVRVSAADLRSVVFVPLYTAAVGIVLGALLGWWLVHRHIAENPSPGPMGPNDLYAITMASVLCGVVLGCLGKLLGEALVSRRRRSS